MEPAATQHSIWFLISHASFTVQAVMFILFMASVVSWYMITQRVFYFRAVREAMDQFEDQFWSGIDLSQL